MSNLIDNLKDAREQLNLILSFFPRVDTKLTAVLAVNTGMLAAMGASVPAYTELRWWSVLAASAVAVLLGVSFGFLYRGAFPRLKGGHTSLIYFKDIACRNETAFLQDYKGQTVEAKTEDILCQVWRNSEILCAKYQALRVAFLTMACALIPWGISLALFAVERASLKVQVIHQ